MSETTNLKLFKHNEPLETNENQFDVDLALNQNWDKIDDAYGNLNTDIENLQTNDSKQDSLISKLRNAALNAETEEAKSLHVTDANKFGQLEVLGNHEQETREGYNLLQNKLTDTTINGVTFRINEDKSVTVNGTATASIIANLTIGEFEDGSGNVTNFTIPDDVSTLKLTGCPSGGSNSSYKLDLWDSHGVLKGTDFGEGTNISINSENDRELNRARIIIYSGATVNNLTFKPMLVAGTEEKPYEQYGAMPSPKYPSKVKCLGSNKQLFNKDDMDTLQGYIDGSGSIIYNTSNKIAYIGCSKNTDITVSGKYLRGIACYNQVPTYNLKTSIKNINQTTSLTLNTRDNTYLAVWYYENNSEYTEQEIIDSIKVEEGTEATSYSPYGQGSTLISKINKNFLNLNNLEVANNNGIDTYNIENANQITLKNKATNSGTPYSYSFQAFKLNLPAGNYNLSAKTETNSTNYRIIIRGKKDGNNTTPAEVLTQNKNNGNFNIDYSQCDEYTIEFYTNQAYVEQLATTTYYDIQIQKGNTATDYIEHQQEDYLLYIQQEMLKGDYFAKEADGWKEVHNWNKVILDETKNYSLASNNRYIFVTTLAAVNEMYQINCICDKLTSTSLSTMVSSTEVNLVAVNESNINIKPNNEITTVEQFKDWIQENNITVYYKLATPTKITCTPEQTAVLEELSNLELFDGVNNIITAEDIALLKLKYALDVKTYVNNQLANINQQILEIAGGN